MPVYFPISRIPLSTNCPKSSISFGLRPPFSTQTIARFVSYFTPFSRSSSLIALSPAIRPASLGFCENPTIETHTINPKLNKPNVVFIALLVAPKDAFTLRGHAVDTVINGIPFHGLESCALDHLDDLLLGHFDFVTRLDGVAVS